MGTPGYDLFYGSGLVNADAAVRKAIALQPAVPATVDNNTLLARAVDSLSISGLNSSFAVSSEPISTGSSTNEDLPLDNLDRSTNNLPLTQSPSANSLFDYNAPELQAIARIDREIITEDVLSSPLYVG